MDDAYIKRLYRLYPNRRETHLKGYVSDKLSIEAAKDKFLDTIFKKDTALASQDLLLIKIQANWKTLAGAAGKYSRPLALRSDQLVVQVEKSVFAQELSLTTPIIIQNIYKLTGVRLKKVRIEAVKR